MGNSQTAVSPQRSTSLWSDVREAIRGSHADYTETGINRAIILLAIPMILEMIMESLFGVVNIFWVARLGSDAAATVGLTESMVILVFTVAIGLTVATAATVARRIGEKNPELAAVTAVQSIIAGIAVGIIVAFVGLTFAPQLLALMGGSPELIRIGSGYTRVVLGGSSAIMLLFLINGVFRGAGDAATAMRVLWLANGINLVLDPCLIFGLGPFPELGITGAGLSSTIGRSIGVLFQLYLLSRPGRRIRVERRHLQYDPEVMGKLLRIARTGIVQYFVATASWLGLARLMATFGSSTMGGYTIAMRTLMFAILPSWGLANAAATLVGQNLGAKKPRRAEQAVWRAGLFNMIFLACVAVVFVTFPEVVIRIFTTDPAMVDSAAQCLRIVSYGYIFYAWGMVLQQAFNGAGDTATPTRINLFCHWMIQIPLAYTLSRFWGATGVFFAIAIAQSSLAVVAMFAFQRGSWKNQRI